MLSSGCRQLWGKSMVPNLYVKGFAIAKMDSRKEWSDPGDDYIVKRLFVGAQRNKIGDWELVAHIEVETITALEMPVEVYRMPFLSDFHVRVAMLKEMKNNPKFFVY